MSKGVGRGNVEQGEIIKFYVVYMQENKLISIIIPTRNEEVHIERSVKSAFELTDKVFVVDSASTDKTCQIAEKLGAKVFQYKWTSASTFSKKMNWAIENLPIETPWVMRLDADEYLYGDWGEKFLQKLQKLPDDVNCCSIPRNTCFLKKRLKHGDVIATSMRILRRGKALYENVILDEHVIVDGGRIVDLPFVVVDDPQITINQWITKHNHYSLCEAINTINKDIVLYEVDCAELANDKYSVSVRKQKNLYGRMPKYWRGFFYFCYRYFILLGFLNGKEGFLYDFLQGWWYRNLVDCKIEEIYSKCGKNPKEIRKYILENYNINLDAY